MNEVNRIDRERNANDAVPDGHRILRGSVALNMPIAGEFLYVTTLPQHRQKYDTQLMKMST